jgi:muramoyltetrapeptide carboxypeptidase
LDWGKREDLTRARTGQPSGGWTWLRGRSAEGSLVGGCLGSMEHLRGTPYWPELDGAILFLETCEEKLSPRRVGRHPPGLREYSAFGRIRGLLCGHPYGYAPEEREQLHEAILERTERYDFPVVADTNSGHTSPMFTLPEGCRAVIDVGRERFEIVEAAVR